MYTSPIHFNYSWAEQGTSFKFDASCLIMALLLHVPLYFIKMDAHKKSSDRPTSRLVSVDLIEPEAPKPVVVAPPPVPEKASMFEKLKALVKKEPPPPPPPAPEVKQPEKLMDVPKPIELKAKLDNPALAQPKLESKSGFQTKLDPNLVKEQQLAAKNSGGSIAPLSAKKLGTMDDRTTLKNSKGNFQVSQKEQLNSIGDGPALAGGAPAPTLALRTGNKASTEKFSAPITQKSDKGTLGAVPGSDLNAPKMGLRDAIIARDAAPTAIGSTGRPGGMPGGVPGGTGTKQNAGSFQGGGATGLGGPAGQPAVGDVATKIPALASVPVKKKEKKSMFVITGPLSNRPIEKQVAPDYPGWAQAQGIEAAVVLEFTVDPMGFVKNSIVVRRTSGYPKLDDTAIEALRKWKFSPLNDGANREEVGMITFNYSLN